MLYCCSRRLDYNENINIQSWYIVVAVILEQSGLVSICIQNIYYI